MWRGGVAGVIVACALALAPAALAKPKLYRADGNLSDWKGTPTNLSGRDQISRGELIATDYLYDDYGADNDGLPGTPPFRDNLAPVRGDYRYPSDAGRYGYNAADLRELRVAADSRGLHALIGLETMKVADAAIVTLAIDADGSARTGAGTWPGGAGLTTPGADRFITVWGTGGRLTDASGKQVAVRQAVDLADNAIEVDVPWSKLGTLGKKAKLWIASGVNRDGAFAPQAPGRTAAFDTLFTGDDDSWSLTSHWGEGKQSRLLATGDITPFARRLGVRTLMKRGTRPFTVVPGFYDRIFRSRYDDGEGIAPKQGSVSGTAEPMFLSRWQPYGVWIPKGWKPGTKTALLLAGHSLDVNHNEYRAVPTHGNFYSQLGDERGSVVITPLARGMDTWYLDAGFADVLEAWDDARAAFDTDDERTSITGYSMGGYMTYRMGLLMPDAFVAASSYVGPPAYSLWPYPLPVQSTPEWQTAGNTNLIVRNGLDLPYEIVQGNADELVPVAGVQKQADDFGAAGNAYRFYRHVSDDHLSFILADDWARTRDWLGTGRRDLSPVSVRYRRYPAMDLPKYGLVFDGAYWVDDMVVRAGRAFGEVEASTAALGVGPSKAVPDAPGAYTGGGSISPATVQGQRRVKGDPTARANGIEAKLTDLSAVLFRTARAELDPGRPVTAVLAGDGAVTVRFDGAWPAGEKATLDGAPVAVKRERAGIAVDVTLAAGGSHTLTLAP
jgi:dienelactone hydrolase